MDVQDMLASSAFATTKVSAIDYRDRVLVTIRLPERSAFALIAYGVKPSHFDKAELIMRFQRKGFLLTREMITVTTLPDYKDRTRR